MTTGFVRGVGVLIRASRIRRVAGLTHVRFIKRDERRVVGNGSERGAGNIIECTRIYVSRIDRAYLGVGRVGDHQPDEYPTARTTPQKGLGFHD